MSKTIYLDDPFNSDEEWEQALNRLADVHKQYPLSEAITQIENEIRRICASEK